MKKTNGKPLTDSEIVAGLRSDDADTRIRAFNELFPDGEAVMVRTTAVQSHFAVTDHCHPAAIFGALLYLAQQFGKNMGLHLQWIPERQPDKLELPPSKILRL